MSKEFPQFSEDEQAKPEGPAKPKRTNPPRAKRPPVADKPKKAIEPKQEAREVIKAPVAEAKVIVEEIEVPSPAPVLESEVDAPSEPEWSEAAPESVGGAPSGGEGGSKRKRRRRKGKGGGGAPSGGVAPSTPSEGAEAPSPVPAAQAQPVKVRVDTEALAKAAWKIYLAEISEEGVALVGDQDARELARRCFRLAEIFLDEQGRRRGGAL